MIDRACHRSAQAAHELGNWIRAGKLPASVAAELEVLLAAANEVVSEELLAREASAR